MTTAQTLAVAGALLLVMVGVITAVLGWIGSRIFAKLDELNNTLHQIASDLHDRINSLDQRITRVETYQGSVCRVHGNQESKS